jgi:hypothetical protein
MAKAICCAPDEDSQHLGALHRGVAPPSGQKTVSPSGVLTPLRTRKTAAHGLLDLAAGTLEAVRPGDPRAQVPKGHRIEARRRARRPSLSLRLSLSLSRAASPKSCATFFPTGFGRLRLRLRAVVALTHDAVDQFSSALASADSARNAAARHRSLTRRHPPPASA